MRTSSTTRARAVPSVEAQCGSQRTSIEPMRMPASGTTGPSLGEKASAPPGKKRVALASSAWTATSSYNPMEMGSGSGQKIL